MTAEERERLWTEKVRAKEAAWTDKQRGKEEAWAKAHPGTTRVNAALQGDFSRTPWLQAGGDPAENEAFANAWGMMGRNRERSAVNAATIDNPNDPYAQGFARTKARIASGSDMASAFSQYKLQQAARRQAALMQLLGMQFGADQASMDRNLQNDLGRKQAQAGLWGTLGQLGGAAIGAWG